MADDRDHPRVHDRHRQPLLRSYGHFGMSLLALIATVGIRTGFGMALGNDATAESAARSVAKGCGVPATAAPSTRGRADPRIRLL